MEISGPVNVQQYPGARGTDNVLSVTKRVDNIGNQNPVVVVQGNIKLCNFQFSQINSTLNYFMLIHF